MKVIDKRTKNIHKDYKYGDILMCWENDSDEYDLFRISKFYDKYYGRERCIVVTMNSRSGNEATFWAGLYDSPEEAARDLKKSYNYVEKVNAYIVITD